MITNAAAGSTAVDQNEGSREAIELEKLRLEVHNLRSSLRWDRWIGRVSALIGTTLLVVGFFVGLTQYEDGKREELRRRFWERKLAIYASITASAARLASVEADSARSAEYQIFIQQFYGDFALLSDSVAMHAASEFLLRYREYAMDARRQDRAQRAARDMALALRRSLSGASPDTDILTPGDRFPLP